MVSLATFVFWLAVFYHVETLVLIRVAPLPHHHFHLKVLLIGTILIAEVLVTLEVFFFFELHKVIRVVILA